MAQRQKFTNEELGINPDRERKVIAWVIGTMLFLLLCGAIVLLMTFMMARRLEGTHPPKAPASDHAAHYDGDTSPPFSST